MVVVTDHSYKRDYWLAKLTENYNLIAISGSHGNIITSYYCCQFYLVNTTTLINATFHHKIYNTDAADTVSCTDIYN